MFRKVIVFFLLVITAGIASAQEDRGRISGLVIDPSGAVIPNAAVTLHSEATGVVQTKTSDSSGAYLFDLLVPGLYTVQVAAPGFKNFEAQHVRVEVADRVGVNATLEIGASTDTVTVQETGGARLKTEDATLGYTVEARSMMDLPILYSNPFDLQLLAPGVSSTTLNISHTYEGGTESASVNGAQTGRTEFTLDGAPNTRNAGPETSAYTPSRDFVGEFRLITSPYDATLSHTAGGSIDASLKSGGRQFHGGAQLFEQFPNVNAPQFSQGPSVAPAAKFNRESVEVDGPIIPRKLFFFAGYEKQYNKQAASTTLQTVPTVAERDLGDYSALLAAGTTTTTQYTCPTNGAKLTTKPYNTFQIFNPYSTRIDPACPALTLRDPVPGNILTNSRSLDPVAQRILKYYPDPTPGLGNNVGQNNFTSVAANVDYYWSAATRIDYTLSEKQKLFGHYIISNRNQPGKNLFFPGASGKTNIIRNKAAVLDYVNMLTPTFLINLRYSLTRNVATSSIDARTTATDLGVNANALALANPRGLGFPYVAPSGFATLGNADPSFEYDTIHDGQVNLTKTLSRHNVRFGAEWRLYQTNQADLTSEKLFISSSGLYTRGPSSALTAIPMGQSLASMQFGIAENTNVRVNAA
ncbi:MAG: carboxypeptidase regulatory-like domain-containing protein, partial [Acidobacteria bacterium]|nr:carboxypeptidase regulatory-like domain-containing protein [Acidobacteriota bacterium]